ncbi:hypothetical protein [Polycladidibacter hongkongensis]|uniref:hypothetical protein n=1 Tax=Polycladidibacter hongkongensis TaxID=1647556 RepID=UPI000832EC77|nr:hypothetical protein [Pseudovibrio hongkongensis]
MEFGSSVRRFDDKQCKVNPKELARLRVGYLLNSSEKRLGIPGIKAFHKNAAQELVIRAEKEFTYLVTGSNVSGSTTYSCAVPFSLKAKAGQKLEVSFSSNSGIVCRVTVSEITGGTAEKAIRKPIGTYTNLLSKGYEGCSEAFNNPPLF